MTEVVSMHAAKSALSQLVRKAVAGETVYIGAYGRAEVQLVPVGSTGRPRRQLGLLKGRIRLAEDFDEPLPEEVLRDFEGGA